MRAPNDVVLFRHGIAEDAGERGVADAQRCLTAEGQRRTRRAAEGLARWLDGPIVVLYSPLVRARETGDIVAEALAADARETAALRPGAGAEALLAEVERSPGQTSVAVGHEPDLSEFVAAAVGSGRAAGFELKKASACGLRFTRHELGSASVRWLLPPKILRLLAAA